MKEIEAIQRLLDKDTKVLLRSKYKGRGRPKKSDYHKCKVKDVQDVELFDIMSCGFSTSCTNYGDSKPLFSTNGTVEIEKVLSDTECLVSIPHPKAKGFKAWIKWIAYKLRLFNYKLSKESYE